MQVRLLGAVDVVADGVARPVPGLRRKALLAIIALHRGDIVSTERLIDLVWGDGADQVVANTVQSHVSQLRRVMGVPQAIEARPPGYRLNLATDGTDVQVAERVIRKGMRLADPAERAEQMRAALALWRDRPMVDVPGLAWLAEQARHLERLRLQAVQTLVDARLALGEHAPLLPELEELVRENPYDERLHSQLMLALYRRGRQADALAVYRRLRHALGEDLGIDPGPALRAMEEAILRQDPALDVTPPATVAATAGPAPAQLPLARPGFVGRAAHLAALDACLTRPATTQGSATVVTITGTAGVGKTALAVHWAHRVAERFPDGQLYVNLRGYDTSGSALDPSQAVRGFLSAFGIASPHHPAGVDAQAALLRSVLAGKRVLLVLDNARDARQVRPLLPGSPGCLALVTSRNRLASLVAIEGAHPEVLDLLSVEEARTLLAERLGDARVAAEPAAAADIIDECARLPLALAVAAARAATRADAGLALIAAELHDSASALDALRSDDELVDVRAVISWSYDTLSDDAARLFRLLSLHSTTIVAAPAAASLLGATTAATRAPLDELSRAHLLADHPDGRYTMHDLLRAYATEQAVKADNEADRDSARRRLLQHYLHTAHTAAALLHPPGGPLRLDPPGTGTATVRLADADQAAAWFTMERPALLAAVRDMHTAGLDVNIGPLAWAFSIFLDRHGHWSDLVAVNEAALAAAERLGSPAWQARALRGLAGAHTRLHRYDDALAALARAIELLRQLADPDGLARAHLDVAQVYEQLGRYTDALDQDERALATFRSAGNQTGQAMALNGVSWCHAMLGNYAVAAGYGDQAVALHREIGDDPWALAAALDTLGYIREHTGDHEQAVGYYQQAIALWHEAGDRAGAAQTLTHLGNSYAAAGNTAAAEQVRRDAGDIYRQFADNR